MFVTKRGVGRRKGNVAVATAACLVVIVGFTGLAVDGGMMLDDRRTIQSTVDAASMAAADELYLSWWTTRGLDPTGAAKNSAISIARRAGFVNGVNGTSVAVNIPPSSGPFAGVPGHAEVIINSTYPASFVRVLGIENISVGARAVARGRTANIKNAIICLDPVKKGALNAGGNGSITIAGAPIQVNSNDVSAMIANGGGALRADEFDVVGAPGYTTPGGGQFLGPIVPNSAPIPDPLADLPPPDKSTMIVRSTKKISHSSNNTLTLQPGVYQGGISITGKGNVVLMPGIYYMDGGGFNWGADGSVSGNGVMIYNDPKSNSDTISLQGHGASVLSPPTSGPYQGLLFFQNRTSTAPVSVTGNGGMVMTGTFYAASALLGVAGNGTQDVLGSQYISYDLSLTGNGKFNVTWDPINTPGKRELMLVE